MNENRKVWVRRAFKILDRDGNGIITLSEIKQLYNAKMHPDVKAGKRTEDDVLLEFLETFETHHNVLMGKEADGQVTAEEFEEYYNNVSASIDTDEYFALMMKSAWKLDEYSKTYGRGWKGEEETKAPKGSPPKSLRSPKKESAAGAEAKPTSAGSKATSSPHTKKPAVEKLRKALAKRGARGILGLARQFKIADSDGSKQLSLEEFSQIIKDYRIHIEDKEISTLFSLFDKDKNGSISYDEFLRCVRGEMNAFRRGLVELAFKKLDKDGSGEIDIHDLKGVYDAKNHPDVKSGKKTEDQVLGDFLETFEMHMNLGGGVNNQTITKEEFLEYYNNVSASIDDDKYFELVIVNAWKLNGQTASKGGWSESYSKGRPTTSQGAPYGTSAEPTNYSTSLRPQQKRAAGEEDKQPAAGYPSRPKGTSPAKTQTTSYTDKELVEAFRQTLISRGTRGLLSIQRSFRVSRYS